MGCIYFDTINVGANNIYGCTDQLATNFNELATIDDNSCETSVNGCTDPLASNFNSIANVDDGSCLIYGCTDSDANNYNPNANTDIDFCTYTCNNISNIFTDSISLNSVRLNWLYDNNVNNVNFIRIRYRESSIEGLVDK